MNVCIKFIDNVRNSAERFDVRQQLLHIFESSTVKAAADHPYNSTEATPQLSAISIKFMAVIFCSQILNP